MLAWLERYQFIILAVSGLVLLAGLSVRELVREGDPPALVFRDLAAAPGEPIRVHVTGAVIAPGVYELQGGDRVEDALGAAGGASAGARLDEINLARYLRDGEQILVPGSTVASRSLPASAPSNGAKLDINTASQAELIALPGIGEAYSRRIIDSRLVDGPFRDIEELLARRVLPASTLDGIRELITVSTP
jgi:competence protein ComEA